MAGPAFRSGSTAAYVSGNQIVLSKPTGLADGDLLIAFVANNFGSVPTAPSGWTVERSVDLSNHNSALCTKKITNAAGEPSTYAFPMGTADGGGAIAAYINANVDVSSVNNGSSSNLDALSVTTTGNDRTVIVTAGIISTTTVSTPAGCTSEEALENNANASLRLSDFQQAVAGATGNKTTTFGFANQGSAYQLAIYTSVTNISISRIFKWNVKLAVSLSRIFKWNVIGGVLVSRIFKWNTIQTLLTTRVFKWNVLIPISLNRIFKWNVIQTILLNRIFKWNVLISIRLNRIFKWNVLLPISIIRTFLWEVFVTWTRIPVNADIWTEINENSAAWTPEPVNSTTWR